MKGKDAGSNKDRINRGKLKENEENKMKDYYKANEHERVADFIKEMLKGLNNKKMRRLHEKQARKARR